MSTPPNGPQDHPGYPGSYSGQQGPYGGQPGQYPPQQPSQFPGQPGGGYGLQPYNPTQPGYNPYQQGGYGFAPLGGGPLAGWGSRVGASILDSLFAFIPLIVGVFAAIAVSGSLEKMSDAGTTVMVISYLTYFVVIIWNRIVRQGRKGQSIGKKIVGIKLVGKDSGQPLGVGKCLGRELCAVIFSNICFLDLLWPLWDDQHQTWHDKVVNSIVVKL